MPSGYIRYDSYSHADVLPGFTLKKNSRSQSTEPGPASQYGRRHTRKLREPRPLRIRPAHVGHAMQRAGGAESGAGVAVSNSHGIECSSGDGCFSAIVPATRTSVVPPPHWPGSMDAHLFALRGIKLRFGRDEGPPFWVM